jgi:hypothetical protein
VRRTRKFAGLVRLHRLRLGERHVELVGIVLGVPAPDAFDAHPHDHRDPWEAFRGYALLEVGEESCRGDRGCEAEGTLMRYLQDSVSHQPLYLVGVNLADTGVAA